ncbi:hypothetical protein BKA60DRAFT_547878 [Fusarium oxysporum]|nr:hypothetical protein BKA60DRAFT_547878 [Fusarium oxysporum]
MGRRVFTNPSRIESDSKRARNRRRRQQQRRPNLARQERLAYPDIRVINSAHGQVLPEVKTDKSFTVRVSASPSASRKGTMTGETGASDKTSSKRSAPTPETKNVALINVPELGIS